ncbi:hypothetical protein HDU99_006175, partial [Rhizoclosmatium hyalinum]
EVNDEDQLTDDIRNQIEKLSSIDAMLAASGLQRSASDAGVDIRGSVDGKETSAIHTISKLVASVTSLSVEVQGIRQDIDVLKNKMDKLIYLQMQANEPKDVIVPQSNSYAAPVMSNTNVNRDHYRRPADVNSFVHSERVSTLPPATDDNVTPNAIKELTRIMENQARVTENLAKIQAGAMEVKTKKNDDIIPYKQHIHPYIAMMMGIITTIQQAIERKSGSTYVFDLSSSFKNNSKYSEFYRGFLVVIDMFKKMPECLGPAAIRVREPNDYETRILRVPSNLHSEYAHLRLAGNSPDRVATVFIEHHGVDIRSEPAATGKGKKGPMSQGQDNRTIMPDNIRLVLTPYE